MHHVRNVGNVNSSNTLKKVMIVTKLLKLRSPSV
jgi:hypothetical protein